MLTARKTFLAALLVAFVPAVPAHPAPPAAPAPKPVIRFEMQLLRSDSDDKTAAPLVLAAPLLSTLDGQTATVAVTAPQTSNDLSYNIALSPTLGKADSKNTVEILWSLRLSGKTLPGATSVSLSGAVRVPLGKDVAIGEITLADPQTGKKSLFRLTSKTTQEDSAAPAVTAAARTAAKNR